MSPSGLSPFRLGLGPQAHCILTPSIVTWRVTCVSLYTSFGADLKRIRLREPLESLSQRAELYNRKQVDVDCFEAINSLMTIR